jgi:hypothetical protein
MITFPFGRTSATVHTDKKENQIFLIYEEIQSGAVAKSYMRKCLNMMRPLVIYDFASAPL